MYERSKRRFVLLGGPGGHLAVTEAGSEAIGYGYLSSDRWQVLATINVPRRVLLRWGFPSGALRQAVADPAMRWALRSFEVV